MKPQTLPRVSYGKLTHKQLRTLIGRILAAWNKRETIPPTVRLLIEQLTPLLETMDKILLAERASELTALVNEKDALRDRAYRILVRKIKACLDEFDSVLADAAETLYPIVEQFGSSVTAQPFNEQTASLALAVQEFRKEEYFEAVTAINVMVDIDRVDQFNMDFETAWNERAEADSNKEDLPSLRSVRRESESALRTLATVTEYLFQRGHLSVDQELFDIFCSEFSDVAAQIKMRDTLAEAAEA